MNVLIAINEKYIHQSKIMLTSLRNVTQENIKVYLLYKNISQSRIKELKQFLLEKNKIDLIDIRIEDSVLESLPLMAHYSIEIYYRLLADTLLPENVDRVLWLDSDIVVIKNIEELYNTDFEEKYMAVCNDLFVGNDQIAKYLNDKENKDIPYFNSGVILFNLKKIREDKKQRELLDFLNRNNEIIDMPDQDALNYVFYGKVKYFNGIKYNHLMNSRKKMDKSKKKLIEEETAIIHYVGADKPWFYKYINQSWKYYWKIERQLGNKKDYIIFLIKHYGYIFIRNIYLCFNFRRK